MGDGLRQALALLDAAQSTSARTCWMDWPAMTNLSREAHALSRAAEQDPLSEREREALDLTWSYIRRCAEGPVDTQAEAVGLGDTLTDAALRASAHRPALERLHAAVAALVATEHPARAWLIDLLTCHEPQELCPPHPRAGQPAVSLLVRPRAAAAVQEWIDDEQLFVDVVTPTEARSAAPWDCIVVFGPPARYAANQWTRGPAATMRSAWLLNAPLAREVVVASWPGHQQIDVESLAPWSGGPQPRLKQEPDRPAVESVWAPYETTMLTPPDAIRHHDADAVTAQGVQVLVGADTQVHCYFSGATGPAPAVVSIQDGGLSVRPGTLGALRPGTHLLFRLGTAEATALERATEAWCHEHSPGPWPEKARRYQAQLKSHLAGRLQASNYDTVVRQLVSAGLPREYSQHLPARVLHPQYIAPQNRDAFTALCQAIGYAAPADGFSTLARWRTARQQAGLDVRSQLLAALAKAAQEATALEDDGYTQLDNPDLGDVIIGTVLVRIPEPGKIQVSRLGRPLSGSGALWQP